MTSGLADAFAYFSMGGLGGVPRTQTRARHRRCLCQLKCWGTVQALLGAVSWQSGFRNVEREGNAGACVRRWQRSNYVSRLEDRA